MSVSSNSHTIMVVSILSIAMLGLTGWSIYAIRGQMKEAETEGRMKMLHLAVASYADDNGGYCPNDLGAVLEGSYTKNTNLFRLGPPFPATGAEVRSGLCDFVYLGRGMKMPSKSDLKDPMKSDKESASFALFYLKEKCNGSWFVLYGNGRCDTYEDLPSFLKSREAR